MKYIKKFENIENINDPQIGDYAIIEVNKIFGTKLEKNALLEFFLNNIGIITKISKSPDYIRVKFQDVPFTINKLFNYDSSLDFDFDEVIYSKDINKLRDILEMKSNINKYNI